MAPDVVILIAEDNKGHTALIRRRLRYAGINNPTFCFPDGQQALEFLRECTAAARADRSYILILDLNMPKVHGIEILETIKQNSQIYDIPVVVVTSNKDENIAKHCCDLGCDAYITKPLDENFVEVVESAARCA